MNGPTFDRYTAIGLAIALAAILSINYCTATWCESSGGTVIVGNGVSCIMSGKALP